MTELLTNYLEAVINKKRLAIVTTHPIQYNAPIFRLLTERGNLDIKVFYTWGPDAIKEKFDPGFGKPLKWDIPLLDGYTYEFLKNISQRPGSYHYNGINNPDIIQKIKEYNPNAILLFGWAFKSHLKVMRYFFGKCMVIFRGDSTLLNNRPGLKSSLRKFFLTWVYKHVDKAIYVGQHNYSYYKAFGLREDQLILTPHAIDNSRFGSDDGYFKDLAARWREEMGILNDEFVFVYAGKFEAVKNVDLLLRAFVDSTVYERAHLVLVGNGPLEEGFKQSYGTKVRIHFMPFQNQSVMPAVYRIGDFYVLPSKSETWGLAINESFASGVPVIASDACGGSPDLIIDGVNGFLFHSNDIESLKAVLEKALSCKSKYSSLVQAAKDTISVFSFERIAVAIESAVNY